ncbi:MAG TPA: sialidase family protein [Kofleriaceae bacterium]|nr:sialidase family protein [Kofleriaceae bacterium]
MRARFVLAFLVLAAVAARAPGVAHANGRFPRSTKLIVRPGHPTEMALGATFGLLVTKDDGAHWTWTCESAVGFMGTFDPDYEYTAGGSIFATTFGGLTVTHDGCHWEHMPAPLGTLYVPVVAVGPDDVVYAAASDPADSRIFKSTDDGQSFTPLGAVGQAGDWWTSIEVAPSDAHRIYLAGFRAMGDNPRVRILFRSTDGGESWTELPTTQLVGTDNSDLQIAAISPLDPDRVFMRVTLTGPALQETIYLSEDAGAAPPAGPTWTKVIEVPDNIPGVVVRADGSVWAATPFYGLKKSTDGGRTFSDVPGVTYEGRCLFERSDHVLFMCANDLPPDERSLTSSTTGEAGTWTPRLRFADITAPIPCDQGTVQKDECEGIVWCGLADQLGITATPVDCELAVDAGIDAGAVSPPGKSCCDTGGGPPTLETGLILLGLRPWRRRRGRRAAARAA